jgi:hypothetical protein
MPDDKDQDKELDPKYLWNMSKAQVEQLEREAKEKRKKRAKSWRPEEH